jgi:hypothetical protein
MTSNPWKILGFAAAAVIAVLVVANVDRYPSKQSFKSEMTPTFATNHIYGSDASISTYGLNYRRSTDW